MTGWSSLRRRSRPRRAALWLAIAQLGYAHWFFGNVYEAVVRVPDRLAKGPMTVTGFIAFAQGWGGLYIRANKLAWKQLRKHPGVCIPNKFGIPDVPGYAAKVFRAVADADVNIDMVLQNISKIEDGKTDITFTCSRESGPGAVEKYGDVPPYAETQTYVNNVLASFDQYRNR